MLTNKKISAVVICYHDAVATPVLYERLSKTLQNIKIEMTDKLPSTLPDGIIEP